MNNLRLISVTEYAASLFTLSSRSNWLDPHAVVNAVMWLGVFGGALIIGSSMAILSQYWKNYDKPEHLESARIEFDEFYDASDNISFENVLENVQ